MFVIKQTIAEKGTGKVKGVNYFGKELVYCSLKENLKSMTDYMFEKYSEAEEEIVAKYILECQVAERERRKTLEDMGMN